MVELLAPAGNFSALNAALKNGANSVYIGLDGCNMRANISNFSMDDIEKAVKLTHENNVKLFICTNTLLKDEDLTLLEKQYPLLKNYGVDAVIVSDLGAANIAIENDLVVHMSVQSNISNVKSLHSLKKLGISRVILSRELSLREIKLICEKSPIEIEVFVHGALCMAISGRCFLSSYLYDKSANCGECLQPCRKKWKLILDDDGSEFILKNSNISNNNVSHFISPRDLCMVEHIPELIDSGVDALKIEGRARPADYVATTVNVYREAIDLYFENKWEIKSYWLSNLKSVFNRGFDTGFYFRNYHQNSPKNQSTFIKKDIGQVVNYYSKINVAEIHLWDNLKLNDEIIIQGPTTGSVKCKVVSMQIENINVKTAKRNENVGLLVDNRVRNNDLVYKLIPR